MKGEYDAFDGLRLSVAMSRQARAGGFFNGTATMELGEHTEAILTGMLGCSLGRRGAA
jgi:hypothetical protein